MITIPVITERCAGIDVGKRGLAAAVALGPADKEAEIKTRWFATTMPALCDLHAWLREEGCTTVAMESTGSWWISVKNELEDDLRITLVCPRKHHPKKGEKTGFSRRCRSGGPSPARAADGELSAGARHRGTARSDAPAKEAFGKSGQWRRTGFRRYWIRRASRWENAVSDVFGVSGQQILRSPLNNETLGAEQMADLAKRRLRNRIPELT